MSPNQQCQKKLKEMTPTKENHQLKGCHSLETLELKDFQGLFKDLYMTTMPILKDTTVHC